MVTASFSTLARCELANADTTKASRVWCRKYNLPSLKTQHRSPIGRITLISALWLTATSKKAYLLHIGRTFLLPSARRPNQQRANVYRKATLSFGTISNQAASEVAQSVSPTVLTGTAKSLTLLIDPSTRRKHVTCGR